VSAGGEVGGDFLARIDSSSSLKTKAAFVKPILCVSAGVCGSGGDDGSPVGLGSCVNIAVVR